MSESESESESESVSARPDGASASDALAPTPAWASKYKATWKREFKLPWRQAGPPNHLDDKVDSDQQVANK